jgi:hypothetical protein
VVVMNQRDLPSDRRTFLKVAGTLAAGAAVAGCTDVSQTPDASGAQTGARASALDRAVLDAVGEAMLPESLGATGRAAAITAFVAWADGYEPVAEEMHGYGYADIRYLPPDPSPAWRAQLEALDLLAQKTRRKTFRALSVAERRALLATVLHGPAEERVPDPMGASHVALALLGHWASGPSAWNVALGAAVNQNTCRDLDGANRAPLPVVGAAS